MCNKFKNLIISPHIDDEVLGCYSFLNSKTFVCYMGVEDRDYVSAEERIMELKKSAEYKKFQWKLYDNEVNNYIHNKILPITEEIINSIKPENILIPHYSYNNDHKIVYDTSIIAIRPHDKNWFIKNVFIYEQPHNFLWPYKNFEPNFFYKIKINEKLHTYELYKSQVRDHRSSEIIKNIAKLRGKQANVDYAEAFQCIRCVKNS